MSQWVLVWTSSCWCAVSKIQPPNILKKGEIYLGKKCFVHNWEVNSLFIDKSSPFTWKNIFKLMLITVELILQLRYLLNQSTCWNICWCHCLRTYKKWEEWIIPTSSRLHHMICAKTLLTWVTAKNIPHRMEKSIPVINRPFFDHARRGFAN